MESGNLYRRGHDRPKRGKERSRGENIVENCPTAGTNADKRLPRFSRTRLPEGKEASGGAFFSRERSCRLKWESNGPHLPKLKRLETEDKPKGRGNRGGKRRGGPLKAATWGGGGKCPTRDHLKGENKKINGAE